MSPERTRAHVMVTDGKHAGGGHIAVVEKVGGAWNVTREMPRDRGPAKCKMEGPCHRAERSAAVFMRHRRWVDGREPRHRDELGRRRRRAAPSDEPAARSAARARRQHHARPTKAGTRIPTAASACSSATTTGIRRKRSTSRSGRTTASSRAAPIKGSRRTSRSDGNGASSSIKVPKDFGTKTHHLDHRVERRDADDSVHPQQGLSRSRRSRNSAWATSRRFSPFRRAARR